MNVHLMHSQAVQIVKTKTFISLSFRARKKDFTYMRTEVLIGFRLPGELRVSGALLEDLADD